MMFLSVGAFAQQPVKVLEKERVCVMERDQVQESSKMKLAPMREVGPETILRTESGKVQQRSQAKRAHVIERRVVPLRAKSVRVDAKM